MARKRLRLYLKESLQEGMSLVLEGDVCHYLTRVMRLGEGDEVIAFAQDSGEFGAQIEAISKKNVTLRIGPQERKPATPSFLGLAFTPLRPHRLSFLIEKATELGVTHFFPFFSERTQHKLPKLDRLEAIAIEAAEQSERLTVPVFASPEALEDVVKKAQVNQHVVYICDERRESQPLINLVKQDGGNSLLIVGPEGGFSSREFEWLEKTPQVQFVSLGPQVLRAETAALAALSLFHCAP